MEDGTENTRDSYDNSWHDEASGKTSAYEGIGIPNAARSKSTALKAAEATAGGNAGSGITSARAAERVADGQASNEHGGSSLSDNFRWTGGKGDAAGKSVTSKFNAKKALPLLAIFLVLIVATAVISFIGQSFQLFSLAEMVKTHDNKTSAAIYARSEFDVANRLESNDPADRLSDYLIQLFADYGFEYIEEPNDDGTVARALVYQASDDNSTLIASASLKDQLLDTLSTTGSVINQYRDLAAVSKSQDEISAAWYGALSVISAGAWYDDSADLAYDRLGLNPGKFNGIGNNPSDEEIVEAAKAGSASEDINNSTGITTRYVWTKHEYKYCTGWKTVTKNGKTSHECTGYAQSYIWDWDSSSKIDGHVYEVYDHTTDPFTDKYQTAAETCTPWGSCPEPKVEMQSDAANEKPFMGDEVATRVTSEYSEDAVQDALGKRAILSAFSTNPNFKQNKSSDKVSFIKSDTSLISALTTMVKNKTTNFANNVLNATDKAKAGYGGNEMNYYGNLLNTPAESCGVDDTGCQTMAATESSSFNSWFSEDVVVPETNPIVQKYNVAKTMESKGVSDTLISNELTGNYNNIDNTVADSDIAENFTNSLLDPEKEDNKYYNYCQKDPDTSSRDDLCPYKRENIDPDDYSSSVDESVTAYAYALTSIDLNSTPAGEEAMVAFNEGASLLDDAMLKQSSGTYGDLEATLSFYRVQQDYLAQLANYERQTKSPFDASSSNTFLGSIVSSLLPYATATRNNAIFSAIAATSQVIGSSVASLLPSAAAVSLDELLYITEETNTDCTAGGSSNMLCDIYGNPIVIMDQSKANESMASIQQQMVAWEYIICDEDDNCKVNEDYEKDHGGDTNPDLISYSHWLLCTQNDSVVNNNLSTEDSSRAESSSGIIQSIINFFVGLFKPHKDSVRNQITCGGDYSNDTVAADYYKVFAQYTLDQRVKALEKYQEESTATAYLRKYYEENPLDQSYEGIIARQSGLSVDEVEQLFAYMEYTVYLARYDSSSRYQFVEPQFELELSLAQTDYDPMKVAAVVGKIRDFEELRSRNFAV